METAVDLKAAQKISDGMRDRLSGYPRFRSDEFVWRALVEKEAKRLRITEFEVLLALYLTSGKAHFRRPPYIV